jgi:hypothetical protein
MEGQTHVWMLVVLVVLLLVLEDPLVLTLGVQG